VRSRSECCRVVREPCHGLDQALVGAVFPDDASPFLGRRELAVPGYAGLTVAEILEDYGLYELHGFNVVAVAVTVDDAFRRYDFVEGNAVLIVAAIWPVHDKTPYTAWPEFE
jgi:hypothetical protein